MAPGAVLPYRAEGDQAEPEAIAGLHAITKKTNYWFERELHDIERFARDMASEWAARGLPRHDVERAGVFEPEKVLAGRCVQLFRDWFERVRTKVQDAIEEGSQQVGDYIARFRSAVSRLEAVHAECGATEQKLDDLRRESERLATPVRYEKLWKSAAGFWTLAALLTLVEFFANFPVFKLLLPMNERLRAIAAGVLEAAEDYGTFAGPILAMFDLLFHVEALVVACVAVLVLVVLGKTVGSSLRPIVALRPEDHPLARDVIRSLHRQHRTLLSVSAAGVCCVLLFLYTSRGQIAETADSRVTSVRTQITRLEAEQTHARATGNLADVASLAERLDIAQETLREREADAAYATTVQRINLPITVLNLALVFAAAGLGFAYKADDLTDRHGEHPGLAPLRLKLEALRREAFSLSASGREAAGLAHAGISRVQHLIGSDPLRGWRSKSERLDSVIPLWRAENARLRGLDPRNVRAFDEPVDLELPDVEGQFVPRVPAEFARLREEFDDLSAQFLRLTPRATPTERIVGKTA